MISHLHTPLHTLTCVVSGKRGISEARISGRVACFGGSFSSGSSSMACGEKSLRLVALAAKCSELGPGSPLSG